VASVTVPTPWYPTPFNRMGGSFVAEYARLVTRVADRVHVVHAQEWPGGKADAPAPWRPAFDAVLDRLAAAGGLRVSGAAGPVTRVPVFTVGGATIPQRAEAMVRDVRRAVGSFDSAVVHGHVGYWGGLLAARLADPAAAVFATEHSTGLRDVLADPAGRDHYEELLERATRVFCVSALLRDQVLAELPQFADVVEVLHNSVEFRHVPIRTVPVSRLDRWVFVGGLIERKGVERLVRAFCAVARDEPAVSLTLFGEGPLKETLIRLATDAGVGERLHIPGVVRHGQLLAELPGYDLLLAPSTYETFHLAVVEGVAAGLPVIVTRSGGPQEALAGVEDLVGRFVDVEDSPDALVEAYRELSGVLDRLDLDGARKQLDARFGPDAIAGRLAQAYGVDAAAVRGRERPTPPADPGVDPSRVVLLAGTAWRRYSVEQELAAVRQLDVPTVVVTGDSQVTAWSEGLPVVGPAGVEPAGVQRAGVEPAGVQRAGVEPAGAEPADVRGTPQEPLAVAARRVAGRLKRRLQGRPSAVPPRAARLAPEDLDAATLVVTDCQSMPIAERLAAAYPQLKLAVELDRGGRLGPPPDARDD
jgi:glycosyltransferase involved in cell wall biosynthesis